MTRDEIKAILYSINANYPNVRTTPEDAKNRLDLWFTEFGSYETPVIVQAVKLHLADPAHGQYYPTIANINAKIGRAVNLLAYDRTKRAELSSGARLCLKTPEDAAKMRSLAFLEKVFDESGAGFYSETDEPYKGNDN